MARQRQSRYKPDSKRDKGTILQKRDAEIIYEISKDQFLTTSQIYSLFFGSAITCKIRLRKLFNQGYLKRAYAPVSFGSSEAIYYPTKKGIDFVLDELNLGPDEIKFRSANYQVKPEKKQHEIEVNQIKVSLIEALRKNPGTELSFCLKGAETWDYVKDPKPDPKDKRTHIPIRPDRFICLKTNNDYQYLFLEVDRGTMKLKEFKRKLRGYRSYYFSGGFLRKYGKKGQEIKDLPFRVLVTTPTEARRNNLIEQALLEGSNLMIWFTIFKQAENDFLGRIWLRGKEYQEVLGEEQRELKKDRKGSRFLERDQLIREKAIYLPLIV